MFVAKFSADGSHQWSKHFGDATAQEPFDVAVDKTDDVAITGCLSGSADFGGGVLTSAGDCDVFVAKFSATGVHQYSVRSGDAGFQQGNGLAVDSSQNVFVTGACYGDVDFGGGVLSGAGQRDIFIAQYDASGGHVWSQRFGDSDHQWAHQIAVDSTDDVVLTGVFYGDVDFGGGPLSSAGMLDTFIAELAPP